MKPLDDHFKNPRNAGLLEGADLHVEVENPVCGDILHLHVRRGADDRIAAICFQAYGCPAAIAAGSILTELVVGNGPGELRELTTGTIDEALGGLPAGKGHAADLAFSAVAEVLRNW